MRSCFGVLLGSTLPWCVTSAGLELVVIALADGKEFFYRGICDRSVGYALKVCLVGGADQRIVSFLQIGLLNELLPISWTEKSVSD